jgi:hypothetical protein
MTSIQQRAESGARREAAVVIGAGKNLRVMQRFNAEHGWFGELRALEHPYSIMQYKRAALSRYVDSYPRIFGELLC